MGAAKIIVEQQTPSLVTEVFEYKLTVGNAPGEKGDTGAGMPAGGSTGDSFIKASGTDYDTIILKNNLSAIIPPTVLDDSSKGYAVKSRWTDTVGGNVYECIDASIGAAVWKNLSGSGGVIDWDNPISINTATSLTVGKQHIVSDLAIPADYSVSVPTTKGYFSVYIDGGTTKMVTFSGAGFTKTLWAGESLIIYCDGVSFDINTSQARPMGFKAILINDIGGLISNNWQKVEFDQVEFDNGGVFNQSTFEFIPKRDGKYQISTKSYIRAEDAGGLSQLVSAYRNNGTEIERILQKATVPSGTNPETAGGPPIFRDLTTSDKITIHNYAVAVTGTWLIGKKVGTIVLTSVEVIELIDF